MGLFLGGFLAVIIAVAVLVYAVRKKIRSFSRQVFGKSDILEALSEIDTVADEQPRSLNGCDSLVLPQILRDFPDFDANLVKTYAKDHIEKTLRGKENLKIYNIVIARYLPTNINKTIVYQAAVSFKEGGEKKQKRYDLHYTYILSTTSSTVAANCPNCGGVLNYGDITCPYCNSRVANVMGNTWKFTEFAES